MHRLRIIPWLFGVGLVLTTLVGANRLLHNDPASAGGGGAPKSVTLPATTESLVAKGTVIADPPTIAYTLPAILQAGCIVEVLVKSGQEVKAGDALVRFDDSMYKYDLKKAEAAYQAAAHDYNLAVEKHKLLPLTIEKARNGVSDAKLQRDRAKEQLIQLKKDLLEAQRLSKDLSNLTQEERDRRVAEDLRVTTLSGQLDRLELGVSNAELDLKMAEAAEESLVTTVKKAAHYASTVKCDLDKVTHAINECTIHAKVAGTIEQVTASVGQTVNAMTRVPLFYLVPSGKRIVSVEVVPDFAHRIGNRIGQAVDITDDSTSHLKYKGVVKRIGSAFLPKANGAPEIINGKSNAVLTVEIEVTDPAPSGQPPLRVGQPVRVTFQ